MSKHIQDLIKARLDIGEYNVAQIIEAVTCPVNRHATRVEHNCSDQELYYHPEWLIEHFIKHGGAEAFAQKRKDFIAICDQIERCFFARICKLSPLHSHWLHCPIRSIGKHCLECKTVEKLLAEQTPST